VGQQGKHTETQEKYGGAFRHYVLQRFWNGEACRPYGTSVLSNAHPALKGGAIIFRACGACFDEIKAALPKAKFDFAPYRKRHLIAPDLQATSDSALLQKATFDFARSEGGVRLRPTAEGDI
jgi:hypothetical protein